MSEKGHYIDRKGRPVVRPSCCIYADLLGMTERIRGCADSSQAATLCASMFRLFKKVGQELGDPWNINESFSAHQFISDGLVIAAPLSGKDDDGGLGFTLLDIARAQLFLVLSGFPVRGGVTYGDLHLSRRLLIGRPFLDAYNIERNRAIFPRMVVDSTILGLAKHHVSFFGIPERAPQTKALWKDEDGEVFINYLDCVNGDFGADLNTIKKHRRIIAAGLKRFADQPRVLQKYKWMASYHNEFCENHLEMGEDAAGQRSGALSRLLIEPTSRRFSRWGLDLPSVHVPPKLGGKRIQTRRGHR